MSGMGRGPSGRYGTGRGTILNARHGLYDPRVGLGRVVGPSGRSRTGWGTLGDLRDRSGRSEMGWETREEARDRSGAILKVRYGS